MGEDDNKVTVIPKLYRTFYDTKANLDALAGLLDGELGWGTDTTTLYRQSGNGAANWVSISPPSSAFYSVVDDLSDLTEHSVAANAMVSSSRATLINIASGGCYFLGGFFACENVLILCEITVDGGAKQTLTPVIMFESGTGHCGVILPPIQCDTSLLIQAFNSGGTQYDWGGKAWTK